MLEPGRVKNKKFYPPWLESRFANFGEIMPFKVTDFGTNQKLIYDFLLYNRPTKICTVSKLWPIIGQIFASERGVPHFNALAEMITCQYRHK